VKESRINGREAALPFGAVRHPTGTFSRFDTDLANNLLRLLDSNFGATGV
jgi:hypothetical protein